MLIRDFFEIEEGATTIFGKTGKKMSRKYRCSSGPRKGRIVAKASTCTAPMNVKKSAKMKATRRAKKSLQAVRTQRTKRTNPTSIRVAAVNKSRAKPKRRSYKRKKI
jgi:hypothetical protein